MRWILSFAMATSAGLSWAAGPDVAGLVGKIKSGSGEGSSAETTTAWKQLSQMGPDSIVPMLAGMDGKTPVANNWIRSAIDAVVERANKSGGKLPVAELQTFLTDTQHAGSARRMAFELLCSADPALKDRWLPKFLDDPAPELRYEAVDAEFTRTKAKPKDDAAAKAELRKLIDASRNFEQAENIAKELEERGDKIDMTDHFGFLNRWQIIASFDNKDGKGFTAVYPPETKVDLNSELPGKKGPAKWKPAATTSKYAMVDLNKIIGKEKNAVAYAYAEVDSPVDQQVEFRTASATAVRVWINGKDVCSKECYHQGLTPDSHIGVGTLHKGKNTILLKICQNNQKEPWAQEWQFQFRITDLLGAKAPLKLVTPE